MICFDLNLKKKKVFQFFVTLYSTNLYFQLLKVAQDDGLPSEFVLLNVSDLFLKL